MLSTLSLVQFRNHAQLASEFNSGVTVIVGDNARGKTNILEAVFLLATGESFRASRIEEMVAWKHEVGHVTGEVTLSASSGNEPVSLNKGDAMEKISLQVTVTRGMVQGKRVQKRLFKINGAGRRKQDFVGELPAVLFRPEDMDLLVGSASLRRRFLDDVLVQVDREYARCLASYEKALKQRNKLLDLIREGQVQRTALAFWDQVLVRDGGVMSAKREELLQHINQLPSMSGNLGVHYERSTISVERLAQYEREELAVGYTLVGPHKDDIRIVDGGQGIGNGEERDLSVYGSRGEQRMAVLWLKEAQLRFMAERLRERPLLLLDDILSELDEVHEEQVLRMIEGQQTILTTTDERVVQKLTGKSSILRLGK